MILNDALDYPSDEFSVIKANGNLPYCKGILYNSIKFSHEIRQDFKNKYFILIKGCLIFFSVFILTFVINLYSLFLKTDFPFLHFR